MSVINGTSASEVIDLRGLVPGPYENANGSAAGAGNDTVYGSSYPDLIQGGSGADLLYGFNGNDILVGDDGNDTLYGGNGSDSLLASSGNDHLLGEAGDDTLYGGAGNDVYYHSANGGVDLINDDKSEAGMPGYGGGTSDVVYFTDVTMANLAFFRPTGSNDLWVSSVADFSDGYLNDGVIIQDFYLGGNNTIEYLYSSDSYAFNLTTLL